MLTRILLPFSLLLVAITQASNGADYESLPRLTLFPGPWEDNIRAPVDKTRIVPSKVFHVEGAVSGEQNVLDSSARIDNGRSWDIGPGGLVTFEFKENIGGRVCFNVSRIKNSPALVLSYSESPFFAGRRSDSTNDFEWDLPLQVPIKDKGVTCVGNGFVRGAFKYLTVYIPVVPQHSGDEFYHGDTQSASGDAYSSQDSLEEQNELSEGKQAVSISALWVNCTSFPSNPNGRAYTGYFDSSSPLLNRVWYAGAWTLQLSTIDPKEGGTLIPFNREIDHNTSPPGSWYSNFTIAEGDAVTTDGARRDRMVWPGDMTIAVPGIAVSTYDMLAIRNALNIIYDHQYDDDSLPYAGPPMGEKHQFSDTYHLHSLIGTYDYILYSGDLEWLKVRWSAYIKALQVSIDKVDESDLLHVTSMDDWIRPGMTGRNVEASALLYEVLENTLELASWLGVPQDENHETWITTRTRLENGFKTLYCEQEGLYADNDAERGCSGTEKVLPQDGNSWVLISGIQKDASIAYNVSENLRARWTKYGAPAVEFPNVISPFASSFELLGHIAAGNSDAAVELIEHMWGYMLDGPGMTNSTLIEGYRMDGYVHYPAYWQISRSSHAHGWASGPTTVLTQGILGIELTSPMGKTWRISPHLTKWLSYASGGFATKLGTFEVQISLMRSRSNGRLAAVLSATTPFGTSGDICWGGKIQPVVSQREGGTTFKFYHYLEGTEIEQQQIFTIEDIDAEFVRDEDFMKPEREERPEGAMNWDALESLYDRQHGLSSQMRDFRMGDFSYQGFQEGQDVLAVPISNEEPFRRPLAVKEPWSEYFHVLKTLTNTLCGWFQLAKAAKGEPSASVLDTENANLLENALEDWDRRVKVAVQRAKAKADLK